MPLDLGSLRLGYSTKPPEPCCAPCGAGRAVLSTVVKGTRRSWARAPNIQVASARANKQQVRLEELCLQSGGLQRRAVPEEARSNGGGGGKGGG